MIQISSETMKRAIARAELLRPHVKMVGERTYRVSGSKGATYTVTFAVVGGRKLASCTCKAGEFGTICYHIAGAAAINVGIHAMRRLATRSDVHAVRATELTRRDGRVFAGAIEI